MSLKANAGCCHGEHPELLVALQLLDSSLSYPPAPANPFHPESTACPRGC